MGAERPDIDPTIGGGEAEPSVWRALVIVVASAAPIGLLTRGLHLAFDLPKDSYLGMPAVVIILIISTYARPRIFRQMAITAVVGITFGAIATLCYLPVVLYTQEFEILSQRFMVQILAMVLIAVPCPRIAVVACRRLAVPVWERPAKDRS